MKTKKQPGAADALIERVRQGGAGPIPNDTAMSELRKVLAYNDSVSDPRKRVSCEATAEMLHSLGWPCKSKKALERLCKVELGRRSYASA